MLDLGFTWGKTWDNHEMKPTTSGAAFEWWLYQEENPRLQTACTLARLLARFIIILIIIIQRKFR